MAMRRKLPATLKHEPLLNAAFEVRLARSPAAVGAAWPGPEAASGAASRTAARAGPENSAAGESPNSPAPAPASMSTEEFAQGLAEIYADLLERQEPLGAEFQKVWDENVDKLYES